MKKSIYLIAAFLFFNLTSCEDENKRNDLVLDITTKDFVEKYDHIKDFDVAITNVYKDSAFKLVYEFYDPELHKVLRWEVFYGLTTQLDRIKSRGVTRRQMLKNNEWTIFRF